MKENVLKFGISQTVLTDQGSNFMSEVFVNVCKLLKIKKIKRTAYDPQTIGALERMHNCLLNILYVSVWRISVTGSNGHRKLFRV